MLSGIKSPFMVNGGSMKYFDAVCCPDRNLNNPMCEEWLGIFQQISYLHTIILFDIYQIRYTQFTSIFGLNQSIHFNYQSCNSRTPSIIYLQLIYKCQTILFNKVCEGLLTTDKFIQWHVEDSMLFNYFVCKCL